MRMIIHPHPARADEHRMATPRGDYDLEPDLPGIALWAAWVGTLMRQAGERADDPSDRWVLEGAASDAAWLRQRAEQATGGWFEEDEVEVVRGVYALWAANHERHEALAARVDPEGYRRWLDRSAGARLGRGAAEAQMAGSGASMASASSSE